MEQKQFEVFQTAIQWVKDEAERDYAPIGVRHDQATWGNGEIGTDRVMIGSVKYAAVCPSACCLAGNIVLVAGERFVYPVNDDLFDPTGACVTVDYCVDDEGHLRQIPDRAAELAGLTDADLWDYNPFAPSHSAEDLISIAEKITKQHGYTLVLV